MNLGEWQIDDLLTFSVQTQRFDTGVATDADSAPSYRLYEDETGTPILTGNMAALDGSNTNGFYSEQITLSAANGFEVGKSYTIRIDATVNSVAGAALRFFQVETAKSTASALSTVEGKIDTIDTVVDDIKAKTDNLPTDPADASDISGAFSTVNSTLSTIAGYIDTEVSAIKAKTDLIPTDPADASDIAAAFSITNGKVDAVKSVVDDILTDTGTDIPATLSTISGYIDTEIGTIITNIASLPDASDIAKAALLYDWESLESGDVVPDFCSLQAQRFLRNEWNTTAVSGKVSIYEEDGSTIAWQRTIDTDAAADPIVGTGAP